MALDRLGAGAGQLGEVAARRRGGDEAATEGVGLADEGLAIGTCQVEPAGLALDLTTSVDGRVEVRQVDLAPVELVPLGVEPVDGGRGLLAVGLELRQAAGEPLQG